MKFTVLSPSKQGARLGIINEIQNKPNLRLETPMVFLHTQGGQVPHLTHEVLRLVTKAPQILQVPLGNMHAFKDTMVHYDGNISEFIGSKDSLTCLTLHDPCEETRQGHHLKDKVPIFTRFGKVSYDANMYMDVVESFNPDMYYLLSDGDTNKASPQKRIDKSVDNSILLNKKCLERLRSSKVLSNTFTMAPVVGGYCLRSRAKCVNYLKEINEIDGFLIDGLHSYGPYVHNYKFDEVKEVVQHIIKLLPNDKLYTIQGCWNPPTILGLVRLGIDVFDTSYCHSLTERSLALTFAIENGDETCDTEMNLQDPQYVDDFKPIMSKCSCLTCAKYTRSYIHHLINVHELLAPVLLMIHNVHHYLRFFEQIRKCLAEDTLDELEIRITKQFKRIV